MIKGIGPIYAQKLVQAFGEAVFDTIEQSPERLREVAGIGPKRAERIRKGWAEPKVIREIMLFLHSHGVGTSRAVRIFKTYGADAVQVISDNPYRLARHPGHRLQVRRPDRDAARDREDGDDPRPRRHRLRPGRGDGPGPLRPAPGRAPGPGR
jgi:ATP-dependent exoDNAse (exonuclease V) alpha subunit